MSTERAKSIGIIAKTPLKEGIKNTIEWFIKNKNTKDMRYNAFTDKVYNK
jgi:dTDP-D-glucose 4,6-dehydratase